jgi:hypothetical protein
MMHVVGNNVQNDSRHKTASVCVIDTCPGMKFQFNEISVFDWCPEHKSGAKAFLMHMSECPYFTSFKDCGS